MDTYSSLRTEVLKWLDEASDTGTTLANVNNAINQAHKQRLVEPWPFMLWRVPVTFPLVANQQLYTLHEAFHRPYYFRNTTTQQNLREVPQRELSAVGADWNNDTSGRDFALWGRSSVAAQPTSASVVTISSSSASDNTAAKAIIVEGETASGIQTDTITPNGTTPVAGTLAFTHILNATNTADWTGTLTMTSNSAAVTNLVLGTGVFGRSYPLLYTLWKPGSADTIEYRFYRNPRVLAHDYDIPDIPFPHSGILVWDALLLLAAYNGSIDPTRLSIWGDNQRRMETAMEQAFADGQSLDSATRLVRFVVD